MFRVRVWCGLKSQRELQGRCRPMHTRGLAHTCVRLLHHVQQFLGVKALRVRPMPTGSSRESDSRRLQLLSGGADG